MTILALLGLGACRPEAGTFTIHFTWEQRPADLTGLHAWVRLARWPGGEPAGGALLAERGPLPFGNGEPISLGDLSYGPDRVVVVEIRASAQAADPVVAFGLSAPFALEAGRSVVVPVRLRLQPAPGYDPDGQPDPVRVVFWRDDQAVTSSATPLVTVRLGLRRAAHVTLANDLAFSQGVLTLALDSLDALSDGWYQWPAPFDLDAGLPAGLAAADGVRSVFVRAVNELGYAAPIAQGSLVLDRRAPGLVNETLLRAPIFEPALTGAQDGVLFSRRDPLTREPVTATLFVYANEEFEGASLAVVGPGPLLFTPQTVRPTWASFSHSFTLADQAGAYDFVLRWRDRLGNQAALALQTRLYLEPDGAALAAYDLRRVRYTRCPHGCDDQLQPVYRLDGGSGALDSAGAVLALALAGPGSDDELLGQAAVAEDGSFELTRLLSGDAPLVYLATVDQAGTVSLPAVVRDNRWRATLGGKRAGETQQNPLRLLLTSDLAWSALQPADLAAEPDEPALLARRDGASLRVAGAPTWEQARVSSAGPERRHAAGLAADTRRGRLLLFGGQSGNSALQDLWSYDPRANSWRQQVQAGAWPGRRAFPGLAYAAWRDRLLLHGGNNGDGALWEWAPDSGQWCVLASGGSGPGARHGHALVAAQGGRALYLFGGDQGGTPRNDLWRWDADGWTDLSLAAGPGPGPRRFGAAAYDEGRGQLVLWGGEDGGQLGDFWAFDGQSWRALAQQGAQPPPRWHAGQLAVAADVDRYLLLSGCRLFGYWPDQGSWQLLDGGSWVCPFDWQALEGVIDWSDPSAVYERGRGELLAFGGVLSTLPAISGGYQGHGRLLAHRVDASSWQERTPGASAPEARGWATAAWSAEREELLVFGGVGQAGAPGTLAPRLGDTWGWSPADQSWRRLDGGSAPAPRQAATLVALPGGQYLLFGGADSEQSLADTWRWSPLPLGWQDLSAPGPTPREWAGLVYDGDSGRALLFGGLSYDGLSYELTSDLWSWDPETLGWTELQPTGAGLAPRQRPAVAWRAGHAQLYLYGGETGSASAPAASDALWRYDGSSWEALPRGQPWPPACEGAALVHEARLDELLLIGCGDDLARLWRYDPTAGAWRVQPAAGLAPASREGAAWAYDPGRMHWLLLGGDDNGLRDDLWRLRWPAALVPAQLLEVPLVAAALPAGARLESLAVRAAASGRAYAAAACQEQAGAALWLWRGGAWQPLAHSVPSAADEELLVGVEPAVTELASGPEQVVTLALVPAGDQGCPGAPAWVAADWLEVALDYTVE